MCGRYNLTLSPVELQEFFDLFRDLEFEREWKPRYNISPTQTVAAIRFDEETGPRTPVLMRWGLIPRWAKDMKAKPQPINARAEGVATSKMFSPLLKSKRCLIPATGFYEWQKTTRKAKQPFHIHGPQNEPFAFAGLWDTSKHDDEHVDSCTIITTTANETMEPIHDRMPMIVAPELFDRWLDPLSRGEIVLSSLLTEDAALELETTAVSTVVNNVRNESPDCLLPL
ncbi:MAG: SOS response-associated peptidase [Planctomycetaceae bacterium]|nr:SOS response-associated peptidase [Planctomycetaceae bacterium]